MEPEEPWGLRDDDTKYQPVTEDITDDEGNLLEQQDMEGNYMKELSNGLETLGERKRETYRCDRCDFSTGDFMNFITHKNAHTQREKHAASFFTCGMCEFATPNPHHMSEHIQAHVIKENNENIMVASEKRTARQKGLEVNEGLTKFIESDVEQEPPLLITEVKSAAPESPKEKTITIKRVNSNNYDLAPPQDIEITAHSTIEVSSISPKHSKSNHHKNSNSESEKSPKVAASVGETPTSATSSPAKEVTEGDTNQPLKWVSITDAVAKPPSKSLDLSFSAQESASSIADESLIGYLELRRIKPSLPTVQNQETPKKLAAPISQVKVTSIKPFPEQNFAFSAFRSTSYKPDKPVAFKFFSDKNLIIATDKGVKVVKEVSDASKTLINSANLPKQQPTKKEAAGKVKPSSLKAKAGITETEEEIIRFTRKSIATSKTPVAPSPSKKPKIETTNKESNLTDKKKPTVTEKTCADNAPATRITRSTRLEANSFLEASPKVEKTSAKAPEESTSVVATFTSDAASTSSSQSICHSEEGLSSVSLQAHKKPKKDFLLRYQNEMYRESANASPVTTEQSESKESLSKTAPANENDRTNLSKTSLTASEQDLKQNGVIDLVMPSSKNLARFPKTKSLTVGSNVPAVKEAQPTEVENGHFCKIVLSRCSVIDKMGSSTPDFALKLQTSLRDCWKKMQENSAWNEKQESDSVIQFKPPKRKLIEKTGYELLKREKVYKCEFCDFSTKEKNALFIHSNLKHSEEERMYLCDECDYITSRHSKLTSHVKVHHQAAAPKVENVEKQGNSVKNSHSFSKDEKTLKKVPTNVNMSSRKSSRSPSANRNSLARQIIPLRPKRSRSANNQRSYACKQCSYKGSTRYSLRVHMKSHKQSDKQYSCKHCQFSASKWANYIDHQYTHKSSSELSCFHAQCGFKTSNPQVLTSHRRLHKVIPQYSCEKCNYTTFRKDLLNKHCVKFHLADPKKTQKDLSYRTTSASSKKEQPFKCVICWYSARESKTLAKHMKIHATKKRAKYRCDACKFGANHELLLKKHIGNSKKCKSLISCNE
ncbi:uncharacterized protein [Watersipora subatra]|uniref:uncharacterized protein isoform X2 n=1 Tax=Watersipora subatra TaxID=2589382 RepID=UPI00355C84CC